MSDFERIGSLSALQAGKPLLATVAGLKLAVFWNDGQVVVTNDKCLHAAGPLHKGEVKGGSVTCPWHGWSYDLKTGVCEEDPERILEFYEVSIVGDDILVKPQ